MSRIRTVKPEFFRHEGLVELEVASNLPIRIAFAGLWTVCDREGRFRWRPRQLKLDVLPFDAVDFTAVLDALAGGGFIVQYQVYGEAYGYVPTWHRHQIVNNRESASLLPEPTHDACVTRAARVNDACGTPLVQDQGEGKGKERKARHDATGSVREFPPGFDAFWQSYPKKAAKKLAAQAFAKIKPGAELLAHMLAAIEVQRVSEAWRKNNGEFIPLPTTWLNGERWQDEAPAAAANDLQTLFSRSV